MKTITKLALGAVMACGIAVAAAAPADAGVRVGIGFGVPVVAPVYSATCYDYYGQPYYCGYGPNVGIGFGGYWGGRDGHRFDRGHFDHGGTHGGHVLHHI